MRYRFKKVKDYAAKYWYGFEDGNVIALYASILFNNSLEWVDMY